MVASTSGYTDAKYATLTKSSLFNVGITNEIEYIQVIVSLECILLRLKEEVYLAFPSLDRNNSPGIRHHCIVGYYFDFPEGKDLSEEWK